VLSEFRSRLVNGSAESRLLDGMLARFAQAGYVKARGRQRTDSTHVLAVVRAINRLVCVGETLRHALNTLASEAPEWLKPHIQAAWVERYERRFDEYRLPKEPAARQTLAEQIGEDGRQLLSALCLDARARPLRQLPAVRMLYAIWLQQYQASDEQSPLRWRSEPELPPSAQRIHSPYDAEAR
jgi:transposase